MFVTALAVAIGSGTSLYRTCFKGPTGRHPIPRQVPAARLEEPKLRQQTSDIPESVDCSGFLFLLIASRQFVIFPVVPTDADLAVRMRHEVGGRGNTGAKNERTPSARPGVPELLAQIRQANRARVVGGMGCAGNHNRNGGVLSGTGMPVRSA